MDKNKNNKIYILENDEVSLKAKGLYMLIKFHFILDISFKKSDLMNMCKDGVGSFESAWKELKAAGYLIQERDSSKNNMQYKYKLM